MNKLQGLFTDVKAKYAAYQNAKKKAGKWKGVPLPAKAKQFVQEATHEVVVLETHLTTFNAIVTRTQSNTRFTAAQIKNMKTAIGMVEKYIATYKNVVKAWMPYTKKRSLKEATLPTYPVVDMSGAHLHVVFAISIMTYFDAIRRVYEKGANQSFNAPVLPFKRNLVNVRSRTLAQAKTVKRPVQHVRNMLKQKHANEKRIQQMKYNMAQKNVNQLSEEIQRQYEMRHVNKQKYQALKVKTQAIRGALAGCLDQKRMHMTQIDELIMYIKDIQQFLPEPYQVNAPKTSSRRNGNNNVFYNV
jgi:hypothetical protein